MIQIVFERFSSTMVESGVRVRFNVNVHAMGFIASEQFKPGDSGLVVFSKPPPVMT